MALLDDVKNYLDMTWTDSAGDDKLSGIISRGEKYLCDLTGKELDFNAEDKPKELLLQYCEYVIEKKFDKFMSDNLHELIKLKLR